MDWGQAKNILIVAFLVLNMFLGYKLIVAEDAFFIKAQVTEQEKEEVRQTMQENNITFEGDIPDEIFSSEYLDVSNYELNPIALAENLYDEEISVHSSEEDEVERIIEITDSKARIYQYSSGKLTFEFEDEYVFEQGSLVQSEEIAREQAEIFLDELNFPDNLELHGIYDQSLVLSHSNELRSNILGQNQDEESIGLIYYQEIDDGYKLYGGYVYIEISNQGIEGAEVYLLEEKGFHEESIEVIPATMALIRLGEYLPDDQEPREINDISFGYYTEEYVADTWEAVPVWRIEMTSFDSYCINAFTGELEKEGTTE